MEKLNVEKFYERQTGLDAFRAKNRIQGIMEYVQKNGLSLKDVSIENHIDPNWNKRSNRTDREKKAKMIGYTNSKKHGYATSRLWVLQK